jgi:hypothetical protein
MNNDTFEMHNSIVSNGHTPALFTGERGDQLAVEKPPR